MSDDNNEDWNFELKTEDKKKIKKKETVKPLLKSKKKTELKVEASEQANRKSRRQLAREAGGTSIGGRDIIDPAGHGRRLIAFFIDLIVIVLFIVIGQLVNMLLPGLGAAIEEFLGPDVVASIPLALGGLVAAFVLHVFLVLIPMTSSQRSLGKKLMKIKIIGTLKPKAPFGVIFIREYIGKPLAIFSVIGIVIILLNRKRKGLHDYISGTFLIDG